MARLALAVVLCALTSQASADGTAPAPSVELHPLGAGRWFRDGTYESLALETAPPTPTHAVIAGTFRTGRAAARALERAPHDLWAAGYPWVVSNEDLRPADRCREGITVVLGLFATAEEARSYARLRDGEAIALSDGEDCWGTWSSDRRRLWVTHVEATTPAYAPSALEELAGPPRPELIHAEPLCTVAAGDVFAGREEEDGRESLRFGYRWARVECRGRPAFVPVETTRRGAVVDPETRRLHQLTDVMCDAPNFDVWQLEEGGRVVIEDEPPLFEAPCAG